MAELHNDNYAITQNIFPPFSSLQASGYDANPLHPDILLSKTRPLHAITDVEMIKRSVSPLFSLYPGIRVLDSLFNTESSNLDNSNSASPYFETSASPYFETSASRVDHLKPAVNSLDIEVVSSLSKALCPVANVESFENFTLPKFGCPLPNTERKHMNFSKNVESLESTKSAVLIKQKPKHCSSSAQQSEETMVTNARARKVLSGRIYRAKVSKATKALKNALPYSENGNQASILEDVIDYIKFLKHRLNVLSQNRLIGEASGHQFVQIEGYGHYLLHPHTCLQPIEELVGNLFKSNPQAVNELLEHKGLAILPMDYAYTILQSTFNPP